jgi:hypothetical protein
MLRRLLAILTLSLSALVFAGGLTANAATLPDTPVAVATADSIQITASAPRRVAGFTNHAKLQMSSRDISQGEVRDLVAGYADEAKKQSNGNWKYTDGVLTAVLNSNGWVVTAWWN